MVGRDGLNGMLPSVRLRNDDIPKVPAFAYSEERLWYKKSKRQNTRALDGRQVLAPTNIQGTRMYTFHTVHISFGKGLWHNHYRQ
jgi:hypothetical protein